jgi:hypothetical protein
MIAWGRDNSYMVGDRRVLHMAAILATYPFAGTVAALLGRALALEGEVAAADVRRRVREVWGDKPSVDVAARKVYTTFAALGVLTGGGRKPIATATRLVVPSPMSLWVVHALLLTRQTHAIADHDLADSPELFWATLGARHGEYPFLNRHTEGIGRSVWADT